MDSYSSPVSAVWARTQSNEDRIRLLNLLSRKELSKNPAYALRIAEQVLSDSAILEYPTQQAFALLNLGTAVAALGNYEKAVDALTEAYLYFGQQGYIIGKSHAAKEIGEVYFQQGALQMALEWNYRARNLIEAEKENYPDANVLLAAIHYSTANILVELADFQTAGVHSRLAISLLEEDPLSPRYLRLQLLQAQISLQNNQTDTAMEIVAETLNSARLLGHDTILGRALLVQAQVFGQLEKTDQALESLTEARELFERLSDPLSQAKVFLEMSQLYLKINLLNNALFFANAALKKAESIQALPETCRSLKLFSQIYKQQQRYEEALIYYQKFATLRIQQLSQLNQLILRALEAESRIEKAETENARIQAQHRELELLNARLTESIRYARRIQKSLVTPKATIKEFLPKSFRLAIPQYLVSGDFTWFSLAGNPPIPGAFVVAVVDCTGHGVPGAFMSLVGVNLLDKLVIDQGITEPGLILQGLNTELNRLLMHPNDVLTNDEVIEGMDICLALIELNCGGKVSLKFSGANRPLIIQSGETIEVIQGTRAGIGGLNSDRIIEYVTHSRTLFSGDRIFLPLMATLISWVGRNAKNIPFNALYISLKNTPRYRFKKWKRTYLFN
jgi:tetratricopeptide (TPR) repeat protein